MPIDAVNDFVIRFANVNGSGSASANLLFARSILRMGVPIAPRNIFPSNIQGLPTWYEVRVSEEGWLGARGGADMLVAMNAQTFAQDVAALEPGGYLFYDSTRPLPPGSLRDDIVVLGMPLTEICAAQYSDPRQRQLYKNIVYVGALAALLDIELQVIETLIRERFKGKDKLIAANLGALKIGYDDAKSRFQCPLGVRVRRSDAVGDRILVEGNFAAGLGAVYGGATVCAWYPITPSTSLAEAFERNCERYRVDPATGKKNYAILQAEDEIAAIGVAVGAGWNGARAFTATSGPGISLMQEFFGLAYFAEIPVVVFDAPGALGRLLGRTRAVVLTTLDQPLSTTTLAAMTGLSPAGVSRHLLALRDSGLVATARHGHEVRYRRTELGSALYAPAASKHPAGRHRKENLQVSGKRQA